MSDASISVATLLADLQPVVNVAIGGLVSAVVAGALALGYKFLGLKISADDQAQVDKYLTELAQRGVAAAEGNLASAQIDVKSPIVAKLVNEALDNGPAVLAKFGLSQDVIAHKITAAIGALQAKMTTVAPAAPAK